VLRSYTVFLYCAPVLDTYTPYMDKDSVPCTAYSCQVMASTQARDAAERARLSKAAVVEQALALGDAEGLEALTYRRLAQELGVTPMALYWHFRNKEELLAGLAERIWSELDTDIDPRAEWPLQLRSLLQSLVRVLRLHPCASQLLVAGEKQSLSALKATEVTLEVLRRGGFDAVHASEVARSALWTGLTLVMSEPGFEPGLTEAERAEKIRRGRAQLAVLPPDQYPCLVDGATAMTAPDPEFHYRFGIDLFVAGVETMAGR
jgi:TetR/AcrR family tetracycline transcriptional repressor